MSDKILLKNKSGSALLMAVMILAGILTAVLGSAAIIIPGLKAARTQGDSTRAYFAAEAGMERALYGDRKQASDFSACPDSGECLDFSTSTLACGLCSSTEMVLGNDAVYRVEFASSSPYLIFTSFGSFGGSSRVLEASFLASGTDAFCAPNCLDKQCGMSDGCGGVCPATCSTAPGCLEFPPEDSMVAAGSCCSGACYDCASGYVWESGVCAYDAAAVDSFHQNTCILKTNGNVFCDGASVFPDYSGASAVSVGYGYRCVLAGGNVDCYGTNGWGQANDYTAGDAIAVSAGGFHTCVLKASGAVDCYGSNVKCFGNPDSCSSPPYTGQAEDYVLGENVPPVLAVSTGLFHTCLLLSFNGHVDCRGDNTSGQASDYFPGPGPFVPAIGVDTGYYHTCILKEDGNVDCYGMNGNGQAADYNGGDAIGVAAGDYHTCILKMNGNVDCYGLNSYGQAADYNGGDAIGVTAGYEHTCVLKRNRKIDCYGRNVSGEANDYPL